MLCWILGNSAHQFESFWNQIEKVMKEKEIKNRKEKKKKKRDEMAMGNHSAQSRNRPTARLT
jgi:hypothetical protein